MIFIEEKQTKDTPYFKLDTGNNLLVIKGNCYSSSDKGMTRIIKMFSTEGVVNDLENLNIVFGFRYINSTSKSQLISLLNLIKELKLKGKLKGYVKWLVEKDDEDISEFGDIVNESYLKIEKITVKSDEIDSIFR